MKKINIIRTPLYEIRKSEIGGIGLFSLYNFRKDEIIIDSNHFDDDVFLTWDEIKKLDPETKRKIQEFCLGTPLGAYLPKDFNYLTIPWHMNHSCDGNVGFDKNGNFIAKRKISKNEELCWDYGLGESNPKFKMFCNCGSERCRKVITGNDWKNQKFIEENREYMFRELFCSN